MSASSTTDTRDQASRLRSMVESVYGPGITVVTVTDRAPAPITHTVRLPGPDARRSHDRLDFVRPDGPRTMPEGPVRVPQSPAPMTMSAPPAAAASSVATPRSVPVIAITSGKGGVGKTCVAVNLAILLTRRRHRTCLLDADLGLANADVICGISPTTRLDAAIDPARADGAHARTFSQISIEAPGGFRLVPGSAGLARMANLLPLQQAALVDGLADLEKVSDVVLVDTGAGLSDGVTSFVRESDLVLVVATPEPTSVADAYAIIKCASRVQSASKPPRFALVVNQADSEGEGYEVHRRISSTCKRFLGFDLPLFGVLRKDDDVPRAVREREPLAVGTPRARFCRDLAYVAERIEKTFALKPDPKMNVGRGLFGWLKGR